MPSAAKRAKKSKRPRESQARAHDESDDEPAAAAAPAAEEEVEVDSDDEAFFSEHARFASFLTSMDAEEISKVKRRPEAAPRKRPAPGAQDAAGDATAQAESRPRAAAEEPAEGPARLPIRVGKKVKANPRMIGGAGSGSSSEEEGSSEEGEGEEEEKGSEEEEEEEEQVQTKLKTQTQTQTQTQTRKKSPHEKKLDLAATCEAILADPVAGARRSRERENGESSLQHLLSMCDDRDLAVRQLAMVSAVSVFKDILPSYRIRLPTAKEQQASVSKEVADLRNHERALLSGYKAFLQRLEAQAQTLEGPQEQQEPVAVCAARCQCELLKEHYEFNFRSNLLAVVHKRCSSKSAATRDACAAALGAVFQRDPSGKASLEAVQLVAKSAKKALGRLHTQALQCLLALPLRATMREAAQSRDAARAKRKRAKAKRAQSEVDAEVEGVLREGEGSVDRDEYAATQGDILHELMLVYFRVLKAERTAAVARLLPVVLDGLAKFSHLVNLETVVDMLGVLRELAGEDSLPVQAGLSCVLAALQTLEGPGQELKVDEQQFVSYLYRLLPRVPTVAPAPVGLALHAISYAFLKRRQYSIERVAAFVRRLSILSTQVPPAEAMALLAFVRGLLQRYPRSQGVLAGEQDRVASGVFRADVDEPDHCNALAGTAWELGLLRAHYHPDAREFAGAAARAEPTRPDEAPIDLLRRFAPAYPVAHPSAPPPRRHPLAKRAAAVAALSEGKRRKARPVRIRAAGVVAEPPVSDVGDGLAGAMRREFRRASAFGEMERLEEEREMLAMQVMYARRRSSSSS